MLIGIERPIVPLINCVGVRALVAEDPKLQNELEHDVARALLSMSAYSGINGALTLADDLLILLRLTFRESYFFLPNAWRRYPEYLSSSPQAQRLECLP
jgi:hypothetical protein